jgi:CheY-like chemotaxis protein
VLVVDDDPADRAWVVRTLTEAGYAVESAATGADALARCKERRFDAITLDLLLPDVNGLEVLHNLREEGPNRDVPVLVLSVVSAREILSGFSVQDVLRKPVGGGDLLLALERAGVHPQGGSTVLVVDDDPSMRALMAALLNGLGYRPVCMEDGRSALQIVAREPPAAIVLDLMMPAMSGFEFLKRLRGTEQGRRVPVLVWSAKELTVEEQAQLATSAQAVMDKDGSVALLAELRLRVPPPGGMRASRS